MKKLTLAAVLLMVLGMLPCKATAQQLFPRVDTSTPSYENPTVTPFHRQIGLKGLLYRFGQNGITSPFPLDLSSAHAFVQIGSSTELTCTAGSSPALNQCSFTNATGLDNNAVKIFYNGLFPDGVTVKFRVTGAKSNAASNPAGIAQTSFGDPLNSDDHVQFLTSSIVRTPVSAAIILDLSGSMNSTIVGGSGTRLAALKTASETYLHLLSELPALPDDRTGAVYFSTCATLPSPMIPANDSQQTTTLVGEIDGKQADGSTSIGDGLLKARDLLNNTTPKTNKKTIILFSDGEQNTPPNTDGALNLAAPPPLPGCHSPSLPETGALDATITKVCPVTLGDISTPGNTLMSNIGNARCGGRNQHVLGTAASPDLTLFFAQALEDVFIGDKLETSKSISGNLTRGSVKSEPFIVNKDDLYLKIVHSWDTGRIHALRFKLKAPDGTIIDPTPYTVLGQNKNSVTSISFPLVQGNNVVPKVGEWNLLLDGNDIPITLIAYNSLILLDNARIDSDFRGIGNDLGTGDPIKLRVTLKEGNTPVTGAVVIAQVVGPKQGIGQILATQSTQVQPPPVTDTRSPAQLKLAALEADPATQGLFLPQDFPTVTLFDDGAHDDGAAGDGVYGGTFTGTTDEGHYNFRFGVVGNAPVNGQYVRTYLQSVFVRAKPDPTITTLIAISKTGSTVTLRATPKDRFNHFLGPDYLGNLRILSSAGTVQSPLADNLDGSYDITYLLPSPSSDPNITLEILGEQVFTKPLHVITGGGGPPPPPFKKVSAAVDIGVTIPHGNFDIVADPSVSVGGAFEYRFTRFVSAEGYVGNDRFKVGGSSINITNFTGQVRATAANFNPRPFAQFGIGPYHVSQGGGTHFGWNVGTGIQYWFHSSSWAVEAIYNFHQVTVPGGNLNYSTVQGGLRFAF